MLALFALANADSDCAGPEMSPAAVGQNRAELELRVQTVFAHAMLYKPAPIGMETLTWKLAPLILVEHAQGSSPALEHDQFGVLTSNGFDAGTPAVYAGQREVSIDGRLHTQLSFFWREAQSAACGAESAAAAAVIRGFRMTLNSAGEPVIWEPISSTDEEVRLFFVAGSLESAAATQYGDPLPGRRYSIERSSNEQPRAVVASILDDGPIPMGPMVYVQAGTHVITTFLCRCTPAQVSQVSGTREYHLLPIQDLLQSQSPGFRTDLVKSLWNQKPSHQALDTWLRLPARF